MPLMFRCALLVCSFLLLSACSRDQSFNLPEPFVEVIIPACQLEEPDIELLTGIGLRADVKHTEISSLNLNPVFDYQTPEYDVDAGYLIDGVKLTAGRSIVDSENILSLSVFVNDVELEFTDETDVISLNEGETLIDIKVVATVLKQAAFVDCELDEDDLDTTIDLVHEYTVTLNRDGFGELSAFTLSTLDVEALDQFGYSVALYGDTLAIGAIGDDAGPLANPEGVLDVLPDGSNLPTDNAVENSGAVYLFEREADIWQLRQLFKAPFPDIDDRFGHAVALGSDTLVISATNEDSNAGGINGLEDNDLAVDSGAVYVYHREAASWRKVAYIKPQNNVVAHDGFDNDFGHGLILRDDKLWVAAPKEDGSEDSPSGIPDSGAVFVYLRDDNDQWAYGSKIKSPFPQSGDAFGFAMSLGDDLLAIGAPGDDASFTGILEDDELNIEVDTDPRFTVKSLDSGAAYLFSEGGSVLGFFKAENRDAGDRFGSSIAVLEDELFVGAPLEDGRGFGLDREMDNNDILNSGAAYRFAKGELRWSLKNYLKSVAPQAGGLFGTALVFDVSRIAVGAPLEANSGEGQGNVYIFKLQDGNLTYSARIGAEDDDSNSQAEGLGAAIAMSNGRVVSGMSGYALNEAGGIINDAGAVLIND